MKKGQICIKTKSDTVTFNPPEKPSKGVEGSMLIALALTNAALSLAIIRAEQIILETQSKA